MELPIAAAFARQPDRQAAACSPAAGYPADCEDATASPARTAAAAGPGGSPQSAGGLQLSPKGSRLRQRPRKKTKGHIHWDEQVIEEHNKERGTRQKIDEADTPYVRSPQTASDSEQGLTSDEEHRAVRAAPQSGGEALSPPEPPQPGAGATSSAAGGPAATAPAGDVDSLVLAAPAGDVDPLAVASRLDQWVRSGGNQRRSSAASSSGGSECLDYAADHSRVSSACSSRSSSSAPHTFANSKRPNERRISLPDESPQPKPTSDKFRAKRAQHYNEIARVQAFTRKDGESPPESDTSEESSQIKTNTNTNINRTISKAVDRRSARPPARAEAEGAGSCPGAPAAGAAAGGQPPEAAAASATASAAAPAALVGIPERDRGRVSFSGESGAESSEDFRGQRRSHYAQEWREDPSVPASVSSLETNTNTNLNAGCGGEPRARRPGKNPMEAGRPRVKMGEGASEEPSSELPPSEGFRAHRQGHYDEVAAVRRFRAEGRAGQEDHGADEEREDDEENGTSVDASAGGASAGACNAGGHEGVSAQHRVANPMEPREACVAFQVAPGADGGEAVPGSGARAAQEGACPDWKALRQAHYSEMAAALRSRPPPSDDDEEDLEEG